MARAATLLVLGTVSGLLLAGCNTMAGLQADLGLSTDDRAGTVQPAEAALDPPPAPQWYQPGNQPVAGFSGSSAPPDAAAGGPAVSPAARYVRVVQPGELRDAPAPDGKVIGYASVGDTYELFERRSDWVRVGADETPVAWIFAGLLSPAPAPIQAPTVAPPQ